MAVAQGQRLTLFVDDFLDLFIEVLPTFDQRLGPALSDTVEIFLLETGRDYIQSQLALRGVDVLQGSVLCYQGKVRVHVHEGDDLSDVEP